jgi:hypothetical protein
MTQLMRFPLVSDPNKPYKDGMTQNQDPFIEAFFLKFKIKRPIKEQQTVTMKNGREALQGKCEICGTGMYRILSQKAPSPK